jgi:hypothetical protein
MRFPYIPLVLVLLVIGCDFHYPQPGKEGEPCASWPAASDCEDGLRCVDNVCRTCGQSGTMCCSTTHGLACDGNLACDSTSGLGTCTGDCGLVGLACCPDETCDHASGAVCNAQGMCEADPNAADPCFTGTIPHTITVIDASCAATTITFYPATEDIAEDCRQQVVAGADATADVCPLDATVGYTTVCPNDGTGAMYLPTCNPDHIAVCEAFWCSNCGWSDGECQ